MSLADRDVEFLNDNHSAAMITVASDGIAKVARIGVALVDGKLWSSGTKDRVRTRRLRQDPRCTLFVFDTAGNLSWFGGELSEEQFLRTMTEEGRLVYDFEVHRAYGLH